MKVLAYSKALYSTWIYLEPLRVLCDAGEGLNSFLEGRLLGFRNILISHAHTDHFTGLQNIFITRLREMEVTNEPMSAIKLFYPDKSSTLERYFHYLSEVTSRWDELVDLHPMKPGQRLPLEGGRGLYVTARKADHFVHRQSALSYRIDQERWSLKTSMKDLPQSEINRRIRTEGRESITECLSHPLVYYSGDGRPSFDADSRGVSLLMHEATFLEPNKKVAHSSLEEAIGLFREVGAKQLLLFHLSTRYEFKEFLHLLDAFVPDASERSRIHVVRPGGMFSRDIPVPGY